MEIGSLFEVSSWDIVLLALLAVLAYRWWKRQNEEQVHINVPPKLENLPMSDMTVEELRKYDGVQEKHILFALNGTIYDVSRGSSFYGPGQAYGKLAGHDATRALGKMSVDAVSDEWDDHEGIEPSEKETADEWESSFRFKYAKVGRLVKAADEKTDYEGKTSTIGN